MSDGGSKSNNMPIILVGIGLILGVALSANVPMVPQQFMALQSQAMGSGGGGGYDDGGW